jgi:FkbM family methyltransferase
MSSEHSLFFSARDTRIGTEIGSRQDDAIVVAGDKEGYAVFGPYIDLPRGNYRANVFFQTNTPLTGDVNMDIYTGPVDKIIVSSRFNLATQKQPCIGVEFALPDATPRCEVRVYSEKGASANVTGVEILRLDPDAAWAQIRAMASRLKRMARNGRDAWDAGARTRWEASVIQRLDRLESLCRGQASFVGNNRVLAKVVVDRFVLSYLMHADDRLLMPRVVTHGDHEPYLTKYFASHIEPDSHCLDVGANFGYFTVLMAQLAYKGKTIGIEPDPEVFELVRDNIYINSFEAVASALQAAVGEGPGQLTFYKRMTRSGNTSIIETNSDGVRALGEPPPQVFEATCISIDELLPRFGGRLDFIKVDVEGAEPLVFRGAHETLKSNPNVKIVMEWSPGQIRDAGFDVPGFLQDLESTGLQAAVIGASELEPIALRDLLARPYHSGVLLARRI